jgi:hypothetical protein
MMSGRRTQTVRAEPVEALHFSSAAKGEGFDKLSPNGGGLPEAPASAGVTS